MRYDGKRLRFKVAPFQGCSFMNPDNRPNEFQITIVIEKPQTAEPFRCVGSNSRNGYNSGGRHYGNALNKFSSVHCAQSR